jgi:hypothetical protein
MVVKLGNMRAHHICGLWWVGALEVGGGEGGSVKHSLVLLPKAKHSLVLLPFLTCNT